MGPSLRPSDKRLAVMVEDHPIDYRTFEGTIPQGNYGAGTVMVWDRGTYQAAGVSTRTDSELLLREGLREGHLHVALDGEKLRGEFNLIRTRRGKDWLLIKVADEFADDRDVTLEERSVATGRSLDQIAVGAGPQRRRRRRSIDLSDAPKGNMPHDVSPMLATLVNEPFDREGWIFEVKWDGYRAIAEVGPDRVRLYSRNGLSMAEKFAPVVKSLHQLGHEAVLDGEIVATDAAGIGRFQLLQNYQKTGKGSLIYYVFDLLYLNGHDLRSLPLVRRKEILSRIVPGLPSVRVSEHVEKEGKALFQAAQEKGLEGIIAKRG